MTLRDWTDARDGRHWTLWLQRGPPPVLEFASRDERYVVVVNFDAGLENQSNAELKRLLDEGEVTKQHP